MPVAETESEDLTDALPVGSAIGGYAVKRMLGQGGFGITYEADNRVTGRSVAIKEFFPASLVRRSSASKLVYSKVNAETIGWALRKFEETTTTLCKLGHPNIVQVLDYVPANDTGYMIMELLHGQTLKDWLKARGRPPTLDELRPLLAPVMEALTYVHAQGLVHRDVAPDNILITGEGRPVLIDFGSVSADLSRAGREQASSTVGLTKRHYTAPEQMSSKTRPGAPADIYSLGAVLYRALCGDEPMDGQDRIDAMFLRQEPDPYRPMAAMQPAVCTAMAAALIDKSLDMRPEKRPSAVVEMREGLWPPPLLGIAGGAGAAGPPANGASPEGTVSSKGFASSGASTSSGAMQTESTIKWVVAALAIVAIAGVAGLLGYKWLDDRSRNEIARIDPQPASPSPPAPAPPPVPPYVPPPPSIVQQPVEPQPAPQQVEPPAPQPPPEPTREPTPQEIPEDVTSCTVSGLDPNGNNWLALRNQPSFQSSWSPTRMGPGTIVSSFGRLREWRHVRLASGETGWANGRFLACGGGDEAPPPRSTSRSSACRVGGLDPNGNNWLALRNQPSFQSTWSSTHMGPGTSVTVTGHKDDWLHVKLQSGETGWANGKFVFCGGD